jgi:hypothetical protein
MEFVVSVQGFPPVLNLHLMIWVHCWSASLLTEEQVMETVLVMLALTSSHAQKSQTTPVMGTWYLHHDPSSHF